MALSAGRLYVLGRKNRLFPRQRAAMPLGHRGRCALSAMADGAPKLIEIMWNYGMLAVRLRGNIRQAAFFETKVATGTTVNHAKFREPDLLNAAGKVPLQRVGVAAVANRSQIPVLIVAPFAEEVFRRRDRVTGTSFALHGPTRRRRTCR